MCATGVCGGITPFSNARTWNEIALKMLAFRETLVLALRETNRSQNSRISWNTGARISWNTL